MLSTLLAESVTPPRGDASFSAIFSRLSEAVRQKYGIGGGYSDRPDCA